MEPIWRIELLGGMQVVGADRTVERFPTKQARSILAYLALTPGHAYTREQLADLFWPDGDPEAGRQSLNTALFQIRKCLGAPHTASVQVILSDRESVRLNLDAATTDVEEFLAAIKWAGRTDILAERKDWLTRAVEVYRGELLPGLYDDWVLDEREDLAEEYLKALRQLADCYGEAGDWQQAIATVRRLLAVDNLDLEAHCQLIRLLVASGAPAAAKRHYQSLLKSLEEDEEEWPPDAQQTLQAALRGAIEGTAGSQVSPEARRDNLPLPTTSFIGRQKELADVTQSLKSAHLVTLIGPGGTGKTRLAIQAASNLGADFPNGIWLVDLASLTDSDLVPAAVASVLEVRERPGQTMAETLAEQLRPKKLLLVLDNCEHLLDACRALVQSLLRRCPYVRVLATSREAIGLSGELNMSIRPLSLPATDRPTSVEQLLQYEAIQLFVERAVLRQPGFRVTEKNAAPVAQICRHVDGIPYAVELAAALVRGMGVDQIAVRLVDSFRLLTHGTRDAPPRHQTVYACIDWSYNLLDSAHRQLLSRLAVFRGSWTLESAEQIGSGDEVAEDQALNLLVSLVDKSLVDVEGGANGARYRLLETVRQYAWERLRELGEESKVRERHLSYFLQLAEDAEPHLTGPDHARWLDRLDLEHENFRAALEWSPIKADQAHRQLRLAAALSPFLHRRGYLSEGRSWLTSALSRSHEPSPSRTKALDGAGYLAMLQGDLAAARVHWEEMVEIIRQSQDRRSLAAALCTLATFYITEEQFSQARDLCDEARGIYDEVGSPHERARVIGHQAVIAAALGDYHTAHARYKESLALYQELCDKDNMARTLNNLGELIAERNGRVEAEPLFKEALALYREVGHKGGVAWTLSHLGATALERQDYETARSLMEESLSRFRELGEQPRIAEVLQSLGDVAARQGDYRSARQRYNESLEVCRRLRDRPLIVNGLVSLACLLPALFEPERAARLLAATEASCELCRNLRSAEIRRKREQARAQIADALSEAAIAVAAAIGTTMTLDRAIDYALERSDSHDER